MKKILLLTLSLIAAVSAFSFVKQLVNNEQAKNIIAEDQPPMVMCYEVAAPNITEPTVEELKAQLAKLETMYADKKIDKKAYDIRKKDLLNQINLHQ